MSEVELDRPEPWTEADHFALGDTNSRIELIDGGLWVHPGPNNAHQRIARCLTHALLPSAHAAGLELLEAEARISWHLLVEPDMHEYQSITLRLLRLRRDRYLEYAVASDEEALVSDDPFPISIRPVDILGRQPRDV
jgi:hypothetical protein